MNLSVKEIGPTETVGSIVFARNRRIRVNSLAPAAANPDFITVSPHGSKKEQLLRDSNLILALPDPAFGKHCLNLEKQQDKRRS